MSTSSTFDVSAMVDALLEGTQPIRHTSAPRQTAPLPRVTESSVRAKLRTRKAGMFTEQEVGLICSLLEQADRDIFGGEDLTTQDLKKLGFQVSDDDQSADSSSLDDIFPSNSGEDEREMMEKIPVTAALTTPDNTMGGNEPIPQEVQAALDVLKPQGTEQPVQVGAPTTPAPAPSTSFDIGDVFEGKKTAKRDWLAEATAALQTGGIDESSEPSGTTAPITEGETAGSVLAILRQSRANKH